MQSHKHASAFYVETHTGGVPLSFLRDIIGQARAPQQLFCVQQPFPHAITGEWGQLQHVVLFQLRSCACAYSLHFNAQNPFGRYHQFISIDTETNYDGAPNDHYTLYGDNGDFWCGLESWF
jgi:hypothetical protein